MVAVIAFAVFALVALGGYLTGIFMREDARVAGLGTGCVASLLLALILVFSCTASVGTKEVGIVTAFNKPVGAFDNGLHFKMPWEDVTEMDGAIQTDNNTQGNNDCVQARLAHQIVACIDVTIRWRIDPNAADSLFQNYRDFSNVRGSLVTRELATDINAEFADYDPLAVNDQGNSTATPLSRLSGQVLGDMQRQISSQVEVLSVYIPVIHFDQATQSRLNALQSQIAQTRIAEQAVKTAQAQAAANAALATSVSHDPNVLVSKCFDLLQEMVNKGQGIPTGFSCWPGGSTGVVIPAGRS